MINKLQDKILVVEIAETPSQHETGLMFRGSLEEDAGMLFKFNGSKMLNFWGMNTYIPLDIAFLNNNRIVKIGRIKPFSMRSVSSDVPCSIAIEANEDFFSSRDISVGDIVKIDGNTAVFQKDFSAAK